MVTNDDTASTFTIANGVYLLGGFDGSEISNTERDASANQCVLSGDIDRDSQPDDSSGGVILDSPELRIAGSNAATVLTGLQSGGDMRVDGFTITAGDGVASAGGFQGGGVLNDCIIRGNHGLVAGGLHSSGQLELSMVDCDVIGNSGGEVGGILTSDPVLAMVRCRIEGNASTTDDLTSVGGARFLNGEVSMDDCLIAGNRGGGSGGISYAYGNSGGESPFRMTGCTVSSNLADHPTGDSSHAGGVDIGERVTASILNTVIWGNSGATEENFSGSATFINSLIEGLNPGGDNLNGNSSGNDPEFRNASPTANAPDSSGDYRWYGTSPLRNSGSTSESSSSIDLAGRSRVVGNSIDIGAYEYDGPRRLRTITAKTLDVDPTFGSPNFEIYVNTIFAGYDQIEIGYSVAGVVEDSLITTDRYLFTAIGDGEDSTEVEIVAEKSSTGDQVRVTFTVDLVDSYTFEDFRSANGMNSDGSDDDADFSSNGVSNIEQFAFGFDSTSTVEKVASSYSEARPGMPSVEPNPDAGYVDFIYTEPADNFVTGVEVEATTSTDLESWNSLPNFFGEGSSRSTVTVGNHRIVRVRMTIDDPASFYRLEVVYERSSEGGPQ